MEQNCVYQDPDGRDYESLHVFFMENDRVAAYLRSFMKDPDTAQMGRVVTLEHGRGIGGRLLKAGISEIRAKQHPKRIYIEAQSYAIGYYAREGFQVCSEEFLEDGIPHVRVILDLSDREGCSGGAPL